MKCFIFEPAELKFFWVQEIWKIFFNLQKHRYVWVFSGAFEQFGFGTKYWKFCLDRERNWKSLKWIQIFNKYSVMSALSAMERNHESLVTLWYLDLIRILKILSLTFLKGEFWKISGKFYFLSTKFFVKNSWTKMFQNSTKLKNSNK